MASLRFDGREVDLAPATYVPAPLVTAPTSNDAPPIGFSVPTTPPAYSDAVPSGPGTIITEYAPTSNDAPPVQDAPAQVPTPPPLPVAPATLPSGGTTAGNAGVTTGAAGLEGSGADIARLFDLFGSTFGGSLTPSGGDVLATPLQVGDQGGAGGFDASGAAVWVVRLALLGALVWGVRWAWKRYHKGL